jgi:hypothetical protein
VGQVVRIKGDDVAALIAREHRHTVWWLGFVFAVLSWVPGV